MEMTEHIPLRPCQIFRGKSYEKRGGQRLCFMDKARVFSVKMYMIFLSGQNW